MRFERKVTSIDELDLCIGNVAPEGLGACGQEKRIILAQSSIRFVERNGAFKLARRVEDANFTGAETGAGLSVVNCLGASLGTLAQHRETRKLASPNGAALFQ